ncbi:hypothetical protein HQ563_04370 [bacterium]|nr:hypothetical protein [bacterium]
MPQHVFHNICFHIVWHTKNDEPMLKGAVEQAVHEFLPGTGVLFPSEREASCRSVEASLLRYHRKGFRANAGHKPRTTARGLDAIVRSPIR